ncbi:MAG: DUF1800 family protein, partial [Acidobacteriaceae bacterium]|nr:DUF1800 family protein [Acidobacteriaceae bacterium]
MYRTRGQPISTAYVEKVVGPLFGRNRVIAAALGLALLVPALVAAGWKVKKIKPSANPPQYASFSEQLSTDAQWQHAMERLTFGARPGDLEQIRSLALEKWLDRELHPEKVAESPVLEQRLAPLESLRMSIHDTYVHYPSPQSIAAFARGRGQLPDDPELRAIIVHLADRYLKKREAAEQNTAAPPATASGVAVNANDESDLDLKVRISDILTPEQIETLRTGKPEEKRVLLETLPPEKRVDFVWALPRPQRQALFVVAPVEFRRELMRTVNPQNVVAFDLSEAKLLRAVYSNRQLEELLVDFWFNHFNVFLNKGADRYLVPTYEREAIRPHVLGKFHDLLLATAESPAMLFYLDNWESVGANSQAERSRANQKNRRGLNENYGRELLELHTLGVDGGYTQ